MDILGIEAGTSKAHKPPPAKIAANVADKPRSNPETEPIDKPANVNENAFANLAQPTVIVQAPQKRKPGHVETPQKTDPLTIRNPDLISRANWMPVDRHTLHIFRRPSNTVEKNATRAKRIDMGNQDLKFFKTTHKIAEQMPVKSRLNMNPMPYELTKFWSDLGKAKAANPQVTSNNVFAGMSLLGMVVIAGIFIYLVKRK